MPSENMNPYESPTIQDAENPYEFERFWNGRRIFITGGLRPKSLWMIVGYTISVDNETFESASLAMTEDFTWRFRHDGREVEGNFRTKGINNGITRRFDLHHDNKYIGNFKIRLQHWWVPYAMILLPVLVLACLFLVARVIS